MVQISRPSPSEHVESILEDPEGFFAGAAARAWPVAVAEVAADLSQRARRRAWDEDARSTARRPAWLAASVVLEGRDVTGAQPARPSDG